LFETAPKFATARATFAASAQDSARDVRPCALMPRRTATATVNGTMDSFRRIVQALRSSHRAAADIDLTGAQLFVLTTLASADDTIGVKEIADRTRTDQSTVSVVVGRLVERGLVKRARSKSDTRRVELSLTVRGRTLLRKTPATVAQQQLADSLERLSTTDAAALARILRKVVAMMGESDAAPAMLFDDGNRDTQPSPRAAKNAHFPSIRKKRAR
jgi:DNA-binding MarR family transcriptional regulator